MSAAPTYARDAHVLAVFEGPERDHSYVYTPEYGPARPEPRTPPHAEIMRRLALQLAHVLPNRRPSGSAFGDNVAEFVTAVRPHPEEGDFPRYLVTVRSMADGYEPSFDLDVTFGGHYVNDFRFVAPGLVGAYCPLLCGTSYWVYRETFEAHVAALVLGAGTLVEFHDRLLRADAYAEMHLSRYQLDDARRANALAREAGEAITHVPHQAEAQRLWAEKGFAQPLTFAGDLP
jgi:hypothetical protein